MTTPRLPLRMAPLLAALLLAACGGGGEDATPTPPVPTPVAPTANAAGSSDRSVSLTWGDAAGATGWRIERKSGAGAWAEVTQLPAATRQFVDEGLQADTPYDYRLTALGAGVAASVSARTGTADDAPLTSARAAAAETLVEAQIGAAGGRVQTADGSVAVELPAGAFAAPTAVRLRRLANTLAPALETTGEDGVAIEFGTPPQQPPLLTLAWAADDDADADVMQAAVQRADGSWLALPPEARDTAQRRFTTKLPLAVAGVNGSVSALRAGRSAANNVQVSIQKVLRTTLKPQRAAVQVGRTLEFRPWTIAMVDVDNCGDPGDLCVPVPVLKPRALPILNHKPGYERSWAVQGTSGGDAVHGTVLPNPTHGAVYTAPAAKPATNPVTLSFTTRHAASGRSTTLRTTIRVTAPQWTGATRGLLSAPQGTLAYWLGVSNATWKLVSSTPTEDRYEAQAVQRIEVENRGCSGSASPDSAPMPTAVLVVNRSSSPGTYTLDVGSTWNTAITGTCPDGTGTVPMEVPGRLQASGTLSADGRRIEGERTTGHLRWEWFLSLGD